MTNNTLAEALEPCPFCGKDNVKVFGPYGWYRQYGISHSCASFYSGTSEMMQGFPNQQAAADAWNKRATLRASTDAAAVGVDVKAERAAFEAWWRMWCPDQDMPPATSHIFDAWLARARLAHPPVADAAVAGEGAVSKLIEILSDVADEDSCTIYDNMVEKLGTHVMDNHAAILAALYRTTKFPNDMPPIWQRGNGTWHPGDDA